MACGAITLERLNFGAAPKPMAAPNNPKPPTPPQAPPGTPGGSMKRVL